MKNRMTRSARRRTGMWLCALTILNLATLTVASAQELTISPIIRPFGSTLSCEGQCTAIITQHDDPLDYDINDSVAIYSYDKDGKFQSNGIVRQTITPAFKKSVEGFVKANAVKRVIKGCPAPKCTCTFKPENEINLQKRTITRVLTYNVRTDDDDGFVILAYTIEVDAVRSVFKGTCGDTPLRTEVETLPKPAIPPLIPPPG